MSKLLDESLEGEFHRDLSRLFNKYSIDSKIGIPDFMLVGHVRNQLVGLFDLQTALNAYNGDGTFDANKL